METNVWHIEEEPSWWDEGADGPFEPRYVVACASMGIAWPDERLALGELYSWFFPSEWAVVSPG